jgi:branched-chain amino acid transport system permease protein
MSSILSNIDILIQAPVLNLQLLIDGLLVGAIFALAAYGMALVWGVMNIINITQGELVMLGGFIAVVFAESGIHPLLAVPVAALLLFVIGWLTYRTVIYRVVDKDLFISLLATFGISIVLQQLMNQVFGADVRVANADLGSWFLFGGLVVVSQVKVLSFFACLVLALVLVLFLKNSRLGQAIRATAQNARAARVLGIDTDRVYAMTYALNAAICGAAGALVAMAYTIHPYIGLPYTIRSFMIVVVAGLGNLAGVILAGIGLGAAENFAGFVLTPQYQLAFVFLLLVTVLVVRNWRLTRQRRYLK